MYVLYVVGERSVRQDMASPGLPGAAPSFAPTDYTSHIHISRGDCGETAVGGCTVDVSTLGRRLDNFLVRVLGMRKDHVSRKIMGCL